ncbi:MAG TPA: hypothetical protein VGD14_00530 [bacterium]
MKKLAMVASLVFAAMLVMPLQAQNLDGVRLFQSYFFDAPIASAGYGQGGLTYSTYDAFSQFSVGVMGGYPINPQIELGTQIHYLSLSPDKGDGQSGITDLDVFGRYNLYNVKQTNISAGAMVSLPIGSKDIGQGKLDFGAFGAIRHSLNSNVTLVGTIGLMFYEKTDYEFNPNTFQLDEKTSYDNYLNIGAGAVYQLNPQLNLVGELNIKSEGDFMMLSGGVDYALGSGSLRGGLGIGLDDGAPDLMLMAGYQMSLSK